jgi:hypothetical protein
VDSKPILRVVVILAALGALGLGAGGCLYYRHHARQQGRERSVARLAEAE